MSRIGMISIYVGVLFGCGSSSSTEFSSTHWSFWPWEPKYMIYYTLFKNEYLSNSKSPTYRSISITDHLQPNKTFFNGRLNTSNPTKILIEGWKTDHKMRRKLVDVYLADGAMINVIAVDWRQMYWWSYLSARSNTDIMAQRFATFLEKLTLDYGLDLKSVHIIAHSLGAHIAGRAAHKLRMGHRIGRLTALEPVKLLFNENIVNSTVSRRSAVYVDVIHTSYIGVDTAIGHRDFYVNGGETPQPGCLREDIVFGKCSHSRSYDLYSETVRHKSKFLAIRCESYQSFKRGKCRDNPATYMGEKSPIDGVFGTYYIDTSDEPPYGLGCQGILKRGRPCNDCNHSLMMSPSTISHHFRRVCKTSTKGRRSKSHFMRLTRRHKAEQQMT